VHCVTSVLPPDRLRLDLPVDADSLVADVETLPAEAWVPHFNTRQYSGDWSGVPLRMVGGRPDRLFPEPGSDAPPTDTPWLAQCPGAWHFLASLDCPVLSARFLRLGVGAEVTEHRDNRLGYADGEVRLHVPVTTGPGASFRLAGSEVVMRPGECWYVDVNEPHAVANRGTAARVHLVVDARLDQWLDQVFQRSLAPAPPQA
jgi:mannose-6-phosphate isomerase-like protein (cupin superfamily)